MEPTPPRSVWAKIPWNWYAIAGVVLLTLAFVFQNQNVAVVEFLWFEWEMERIVLMLILLLVGVLVGVRLGVPLGARLARRSSAPKP